MAKRTIDEVESASAVNGATDAAPKKSKKDKSEKKSKKVKALVEETAAISINGHIGDVKIDKKEKKEKKDKKDKKKKDKREKSSSTEEQSWEQDPSNGINGDSTAMDIDSPASEEPKLSKEERKAAKAAKKASKAAKATNGAKLELESNGAAKTEILSSSNNTGNSSSTASTLGSYTEHPDLAAVPQSAIDDFLTKNFITFSDPTKAPRLRPITKFSYFPLEEEKQRQSFLSFTSAFTEPTPIQAAVWPYLVAGRDCIGVAETGSGKTLAFAVPAIRRICALPAKERKGVKVVVVSPTRELAMQIFEHMDKLAKGVGLTAVCVYGGVPKEDQRRLLKTATIVVATPGRLNDLVDEGSADLSKAEYVVLDEADRMLDKGFEDAIRQIIGATKKEGRQTLMFTATWPPSVRDLAATFMKNPVHFTIGDNPTGDLRANVRITQTVEVLDHFAKEGRLVELLKKHQSNKNKDDRILVFCLYKKEATRVENLLRNKGFRVAAIHGDLNQGQRTQALQSFKDGKCPLLIATDVAARGLDIPSVKMVINVTFPLTIEDYVHRIGRTGRAGKTGIAHTFFTDHDKAHSGALVNILKAAGQEVPESLLKFGTTVKKKEHSVYGAFFKDTEGAKAATKIKFE